MWHMWGAEDYIWESGFSFSGGLQGLNSGHQAYVTTSAFTCWAILTASKAFLNEAYLPGIF